MNETWIAFTRAGRNATETEHVIIEVGFLVPEDRLRIFWDTAQLGIAREFPGCKRNMTYDIYAY
jgi:hypothetical protein